MNETKREHYRKGKHDIMYENNEGSKWELTICAETFESGVKIVMSQKKKYIYQWTKQIVNIIGNTNVIESKEIMEAVNDSRPFIQQRSNQVKKRLGGKKKLSGYGRNKYRTL